MSDTATAEPRDRLIEAAESHFRRFGYRRATIDDITREAATGKGSFYLHFTSKETAYLAVVESSLQRFLELAAKALLREASVPDRLRALVEVTADYYSKDELLRASLLGDLQLVDGPIARRAAEIQRARIRSLLAATLRAGQTDGSIRANVDVDVAAAVLFEAGWAVVRAELEGMSDVDFNLALTTLNQIVGLGLVPRDRPAPGASESRT